MTLTLRTYAVTALAAVLFAIFGLPLPGLAAGNLVENGSLETASPSSSTTPSGWTKGRWGTNSAVFSYPVPGPDGSKAAQVALTSRASGDAKWAFAPVSIEPGRTYEYRDRYRADVPTFVTLEIELADGSRVYPDIAYPEATSGWSETRATFTAPLNARKATAYHLINRVGTLAIDDASLTDVTPPAPPASNLFENPSFEEANASGLPAHFIRGRWGTNATTFSYPVAGKEGHGARVEMASHSSGDAKWTPDQVQVTPGGVYEFSDYFRASARTYVTVQLRKSDGSTSYLDIGYAEPAEEWTRFKRAFTVPAGVASLTVFHLLNRAGWLEVDEYSLRKVASDPTRFEKGQVSLNFDDGWRSVYDHALPALDAAGFVSDQFITTSYVLNGFPGYMTSAQVLDMQARGHVIGAHTRTHADLTSLSEPQARAEIEGSRQDLVAMGAAPVAHFAYPFGAYNAQVQRMVRDAGFLAGRSSNGGYNDKTTDPFALRRQPMTKATTFAEAKGFIDKALADKTWVILLFHRVDESGDAYAVTPALFRQIVAYLAEKGVEPITVGDGIRMMSE